MFFIKFHGTLYTHSAWIPIMVIELLFVVANFIKQQHKTLATSMFSRNLMFLIFLTTPYIPTRRGYQLWL